MAAENSTLGPANSAPLSIGPAHRALACAGFSATTTPLITGMRDSSATSMRPFVAAVAMSS